jgi:hypothetical protein
LDFTDRFGAGVVGAGVLGDGSERGAEVDGAAEVGWPGLFAPVRDAVGVKTG